MEEKILRLVEQLQQLYFEDRNLQEVLLYFDENISWFGMGPAEVCFGREEAARLFQSEQEKFSGSFTVLDHWYEVTATAASFYMVRGQVKIMENGSHLAVAPFEVRLSILCRVQGEDIRLVHVHMSVPSSEQEEGEFFPTHLEESSKNALRHLVDEQSAKLAERSTDLQVLTRNLPGGVFRCRFDDMLSIQDLSDGFLHMFGYTREEVFLRFHDSFWEMIHPDDRDFALSDAKHQLETGDTKELEYRVLCRDGSYMWVMDRGQLVRSQEGGDSFYCILIDINKRKEAQEQLRLSLERHQIIMAQTNEIIFEWDIRSDSLLFSSNWEKKFTHQPLQENVSENLDVSSHIHPDDQKNFRQLMAHVRQGIPYDETEMRLLSKEEEYAWHRCRITTQFDAQGYPVKGVGVLINIDEEKRRSQKLLERAQRDALTKLYNKGTCHSLMEDALKHLDAEECAAMLIVDVDDFKCVNDTMGHLYGDAFLMEVAAAIQKLFRGSDIVGRIGGDEFMVFMNHISDAEIACKKAKEMIEAFQDICRKEKDGLQVSCSVGIAMAPEHGKSYLDLFRHADFALYQAKKEGKNRYELFDQRKMEGSSDGIPMQMVTAISEKIDSNEKNGVSGQLVEYVLRILYKSIDIERAVDSILEIVGRQYQVSRAYIFENSEDDTYCTNTFEWCNDGVTPEIGNLKRVSYVDDMAGVYEDNFDENGIFYCRDITDLPRQQYEILEPQGIKSMLQCAIRDNGRFKGFVGFDECNVNRLWTQEQIDALSFISEILSTFLLKMRVQDRMSRTTRSLQEVLDNQNSWIYVIDPETYELLYINRKTLSIAPAAKKGMFCYQSFFGRKEPCQNCPARDLRQSGQSNFTMEVFNPILHVWSAADASSITWKGKEATLLCCHDITRYKVEN
ncbi:diguanylate cyclase domain-containing protein [Zongyangia hominis]|uniref:Diguanylate cyclase n=1 Tax=Zongyangia hominis TaxID=2763677 RepID=A0A926EAM6_9FIRM|nr:diguanylate cyclase [Zongyangia hominis]MBC8569500.1 diguanylate cyclase [Zongyangia hominis]